MVMSTSGGFRVMRWRSRARGVARGRHDGAARSLREGLEETLTITRLDLPPSLVRCLKSTNVIDSAISVGRTVTRNVKRLRDARMVLRWQAAGCSRPSGSSVA